MSRALRNAIRTIALGLALGLLALGIVTDALPRSPGDTTPPDDTRWLASLGAAFVLFMVYTVLTVAGDPTRPGPTPDERFRRNVQHLGGFLLVGFALLSAHMLREQIVAASVIKGATVVTESGAIVQDPRKVPEQLSVRRGAIYAGDRVVAASEVITPSRFAHRIYPEPNLSYLAGYYNPTVYGSAGLEAAFDSYLSGARALDPLLEKQREILNQPRVGNDLYLTIDPNLQNRAHELLGERMGGVVLMDAQSGAILALASWPHIDPGQLSFNPYAEDWGEENRRIIDYYTRVLADETNPLVMRATQGLYPPGSTFKTVSAAAALDTNTAMAGTIFTDTNGTIKVEPGNYVHVDCATCRPRNHGPRYSLAEGYKWSLNVVFAELAMRLGPQRMIEYARRFGFGTRYDLGVPVEASTIVSDTADLEQSRNLLAATAYGQGDVLATPLQMALVAATVAHGGEVPAPHLASAVRDPETGGTVWQFQPHNLGRAISPQTNNEVRLMMVESVKTGWAGAAAIQGATVGGKTGTAETGRDTSHSWFIGFAGRDPNVPQYAVAVV
ncbi:MAG TPA: penicillin-binding protein 2, partial [Chloroflexia bacterium]|nr:penicillin-binding protein 2 [Chloroflexia bacterium]